MVRYFQPSAAGPNLLRSKSFSASTTSAAAAAAVVAAAAYGQQQQQPPQPQPPTTYGVRETGFLEKLLVSFEALLVGNRYWGRQEAFNRDLELKPWRLFKPLYCVVRVLHRCLRLHASVHTRAKEHENHQRKHKP